MKFKDIEIYTCNSFTEISPKQKRRSNWLEIYKKWDPQEKIVMSF